MSVSDQIGLRLADNSFYPVFENGMPGRKRMVLTTARDNQERVDVSFWRAYEDDPGAGEPLGTVSLDNLQSDGGGVPDLDLHLTITEDGRLDAAITERSTGNSRSVSMSLEEPGLGDLEFDTDSPYGGFDDTFQDDPFQVASTLNNEGLYEQLQSSRARKRSRTSAALWIILMVLLFTGLGWAFFRFVLRSSVDPPPVRDATVERAEPAPEDIPAETPREISPEEPTPVAPVAEEPAPEDPPVETPREASAEERAPGRLPAGVENGDTIEVLPYEIVRGDTLWDISERFYGTPWLFPALAHRNRIRDPNLIFADEEIFIPGREYLER